MQGALPCRPGRNLSPVLVDSVPVELTTTSIHVHLVCAQPAAPLPEVSDDPEEEHDGKGEVYFEETFGSVKAGLSNGRGDGSVEL